MIPASVLMMSEDLGPLVHREDEAAETRLAVQMSLQKQDQVRENCFSTLTAQPYCKGVFLGFWSSALS